MFMHHRTLCYNLRLVATDYPGIGKSTFKAGERANGPAQRCMGMP